MGKESKMAKILLGVIALSFTSNYMLILKYYSYTDCEKYLCSTKELFKSNLFFHCRVSFAYKPECIIYCTKFIFNISEREDI